MSDTHFGLTREVPEDKLEFGDWGALPLWDAVASFHEPMDYFDEPEVRKEHTARQDYIQTCQKWFEGYHPKPLKVKQGEHDDNMLVNYCRTIIGDSVSWLWGNRTSGVVGIQPIVDGEAEGTHLAAEALKVILQKSGGFKLLKKWGQRGTIAGHFFVKLVPTPDKPIANLTPEDIRFRVLDPNLVNVYRDPREDEEVLAYVIEWKKKERDTATGQHDTFIYRQLVTKVGEDQWVIVDFKTKDRAERNWFITGGPWAWPWKWCPIIDGPNIEAPWGYFGYSDLEDITGLNNGINTAISNYGKILRHHADPKTIGTGFDSGDVQKLDIGSFWTIRKEGATIKNLEMQTDLQSSLNYVGLLINAFWTIGRGLDPTAYRANVANVTNFGLRVLAMRALEKLDDKRATYGEGLKLLITRALDMLGKTVKEVSIEWPDPLPRNPTTVIDRLEKELGMQVTSRETAAGELGRTWEVEKKRIEGEASFVESLGAQFLSQFDKSSGGGILDEQRSPDKD